jgi:hypothetical protein
MYIGTKYRNTIPWGAVFPFLYWLVILVLGWGLTQKNLLGGLDFIFSQILLLHNLFTKDW